jgi:hypothetical protein
MILREQFLRLPDASSAAVTVNAHTSNRALHSSQCLVSPLRVRVPGRSTKLSGTLSVQR